MREFDVVAEKGLADEEIERRRKQYGAKQLRETETRSALMIFLQQFKSVVILILVVAAIVAFSSSRFPEGFALLAVTLINAAIGFFSEWKAVCSMEALRDLSQHNTRVLRDGAEREFSAVEMVPGDIAVVWGLSCSVLGC